MLTEDGVKSHLTKQVTSRDGLSRDDDKPFRLELFSPDQRRERGIALGQEHRASRERKGGDRLLRRLADNEEVLRAIHRQLVDDVTGVKPLTPVGDWILDNFYIIEEQIGLAKRHLPRRYLLELPRLSNPGKVGIPRVYDLAEHVVAYSDSRVDMEGLGCIVSAYQEVTPLRLGELWAIPIMLRFALIENIRRMAVLMSQNRVDQELARTWADDLIRIDEEEPKNLILAVADMARTNPSLSGAFVAEFKRKLHGRGSAMKLPLQWVEQSLNEHGRSVDHVVTEENHEQAIMEISTRNCITSLRNLSSTDWNEFVETLSRTEQILREDPADVYSKMDFATRDEYRRVVERMSRRGRCEEESVAMACLDLARNGATLRGTASREAHVGNYLVGKGDHDLRRKIGCRPALGDMLRGASTRVTLGLYLGAIIVLTAVFTAFTIFLAHVGGVRGDMLLVTGILLAFTTGHLAVGLVNYLATQLVRPRRLPRMDFSDGIRPEERTLVVVPTLLQSERGIGEMLRGLEMHYLGNPGANIHFGLLTDFADAPTDTTPDDERLLNLCRLGILKLNDKYTDNNGNNFFLFHRPRRWNETEKIWMGWERKRGKLEDLNRFLLGEYPNVFSCVEGQTQALANVRYVITLDADTVMARDSAVKMVGAMAHPLNRPVYDERLGRVVQGHGILQPRVDANLSGANRTLYARMGAGDIGIDPYTTASSDVYQDLFDEGSFIGKGIYDVHLFDQALGRRFPDNKILSHDLLEGCVVRSGLLGDVKLYEDPPRTYLMDIARRHRWVRGDWQIASYLIAKETFGGKQTDTKPLGVLSQWKVIDNLRRSLTPIALVLLMILALAFLTNPGMYLLVGFGVYLGPVIVSGLVGLFRKSPDKTIGQHLRSSLMSTFRQAEQVLFKFSCQPFEAMISADAILRSLWRQIISHKHLLQWNPSANSLNAGLDRFGVILGRMWIGPVAAVVMAGVIMSRHPGLLLYAAPLLLLWFLSPLFAWILSRPRRAGGETLTAKQAKLLAGTARRVWHFFETFVGPEDNWLPPDNYQENPKGVVAHRTSPTNIGLSLLSNLTAHDFGFITSRALLERTERTFATLRRMKRFRGHLYNWYDTTTLQVLRPAYISTVDSGNFAGHVLILASGLREIAMAPILDSRVFSGLLVTLDLALSDADKRTSRAMGNFDSLRKLLVASRENPPETAADYHVRLREVEDAIANLDARWLAGPADSEAAWTWFDAVKRQCQAARQDLDALAPWAKAMASTPEWRDIPELRKLPSLLDTVGLGDRINAERSIHDGGEPLPNELVDLLHNGSDEAHRRLASIQHLLVECEDFADIDLEFLYDKGKRFLSIGYNASDHRLDESFYDLLASEARLAAYVGIAQHKLPQESWFALGRMLTLPGKRPLLISWSGSMFEYLMPALVMPCYEDTLLDDTCKACVEMQIEYGNSRNVPWGISESGYYLYDAEQNYQYRAFGVPELGLKHTANQDLVIAPYATCLAAMVYPARAAENLRRMQRSGFSSIYGFYEAVDFTPTRLPRGETHAVVQSYMAHHQGMSLVALGQVLLGKPMHRRFEANPLLHSASQLLEEMVPAEKALYFHSTYSPEHRPLAAGEESPVRVVDNPDTPIPEVHLLSNGRYHVMVTAAGGGYSRYDDVSLTRWKEDPTRDNWGTFCYLRDRESGDVWSNTHQPTCLPNGFFEATFAEGKAEYHRRDGDFDCYTEIVVSPEDDVEVRRIRITNRSGRERLIDVTSYAEIALNTQAADDSHPAFSKLFVETRIIPERQAIVATRRPRKEGDIMPQLFHMLAVRGLNGGDVSYESDRLAFLGRGNDATAPRALDPDITDLSGCDGAVLDPVFAIRSAIRLEAGGVAIVDLVTGAGQDEADANRIMEKYQDQRSTEKALDMAWTHGQLLLRQLNITDAEALRFTQLAGSILFANPAFRANPAIIMKNRQGQSGLWGYAISGDVPLVLLKASDPSRIKLVNTLIQAHSYWRQKGLKVDLMIWNDDESGYRQELHDQIAGLAGAALDDAIMEKPGGIFIRSTERIAPEDRVLIETVARVVISDSAGSLEEQLRRVAKFDAPSDTSRPFYSEEVAEYEEEDELDDTVQPGELVFDNGYGGFRPDGREYVVVTDDNCMTPLPWVNVMANPHFGTIASEAGAFHTWSENAHEFRLTPWRNDPVSDQPGECLYIRDEETGRFWSPTPLPCRTGGRFVTRHGFGYSIYEHSEQGIHSELTVHVDRHDGIKFFTLSLKNVSERQRNLSVTGYVEWVLGDIREKTGMHVITGIDSHSGALIARNHYNGEFRGRTVFLDVNDPGRTVTGDRREFVGRNRSLQEPRGMRRDSLSGRVGPGLDPCGAAQVKFNLGPGQEREVVFRLGVADNLDAARRLIRESRGVDDAHASLKAVKAYWKDVLGTITVETPDQAFNFMANGWLLYQTLSCRFWGRSATYQSGGAIGFRDQLQDSMALLYAEPGLVRSHILDCAAHQFPEGDVLHWWHPPSGRGVRTKCSDDYLWLAYCTERYIRVTGDTGILDEKVRFIQGRPLRDDEESYYDLMQKSDETASLYEHCRRSIQHGLRLGRHGLPLMGSGDWNDGMDLVGIDGAGESVWLAFFLYSVLMNFAGVAERRGDDDYAALCRDNAVKLAESIRKNTWDGDWYRRAYFDDGTPLGSKDSPECTIDSIAQSWSVLSGAGDIDRARQAMKSLDERLIDDENLLVRLFTPAFNTWEKNPGYIKGYVPGVRENGGQYTHAAIWAAMAFAAEGDRENAWRLQKLLNPISHGSTTEWAEKYMAEPYVIAADIYTNPQHPGRGGWSWYTGSASWLYRFLIESILGFGLEVDTVKLNPCVPADWQSFRIRLNRRGASHDIVVRAARSGVVPSGVDVDGVPGDGPDITLPDDRQNHSVEVRL